MTDDDRARFNICPKCKKPGLTIMVTQTVVAPRSMQHNFTRANMRKKEFEHWGTSWDMADILCRTDGCGYVNLRPFRGYATRGVVAGKPQAYQEMNGIAAQASRLAKALNASGLSITVGPDGAVTVEAKAANGARLSTWVKPKDTK